MLTDQAKAELIILSRQEKLLNEQCAEWYNNYARPLFDQCSSMDEYRSVRNQFPWMTDIDGTSLDVPSMIGVYLAFAQDAVRARAGEYDAS